MVEFIDRVNLSIDNSKAVVADMHKASVDRVLVDRWKDNLDALMIHPGSVETRIGFIGRTGAGKSQALNAILGESDIFPTSGYKACTATVIEAKYHPNDNYKAVFEFKTMREWREDFEKLTRELSSLSLPEENGQHEEDQDEEIGDQQLEVVQGTVRDLLRALLGERVTNDHISTKESLNRLFQEASDRHCNFLSLNDKPWTKDIECDRREDFREAIRPYVTQHDAIGVQCYWPLVNKCSIYHNWEVLQDGVILVDLPGIADANYVRGGVAKAYLDNCHALFVVAESRRALDDRDARNLGLKLHKELSRQLQMDGKLNTVSYLLTKIDQYQPEELTREEGKLKEWRKAINEKLKVEEEMEEMDNLIDSNDSRTPDQYRKLKSRRDHILDEIVEIEKTCLHLRIKRQKVRVTELINCDFEEEQQDQDSDVNVFCISAVRALGLPSSDSNASWKDERWRMEDTGIPKLRDYLKDVSRNHNFKLARRSLGLLYSQISWLATILTFLADPDEQIQETSCRKMISGKVIEMAEKEIDHWSDDMTNKIRLHELQNQLNDGKNKAIEKAIEIQREWGKRLEWTVYNLAMRDYGDFQSVRYGHVDMNYHLVVPIIDAIQLGWKAFFEESLDISSMYRNFDNIKDLLPELEAEDEGLSEDFKDTWRHYVISCVSECIQQKKYSWDMKIKYRQSLEWRKLSSHIQFSLSKAYDQAARIYGNDLLHRMENIMLKTIRSKRDRMFEQAILVLIDGLYELIDEIRMDAEQALDELAECLKSESLVTIEPQNLRICIGIVGRLCEQANNVLTIGQECGLEHDAESERRLKDAIERIAHRPNQDDLAGAFEEKLGLNTKPSASGQV